MASIWTDAARWEHWLKIELLALTALAKEGKVPGEALKKIETKAKINPKRIEEIEAQTRHDVIAFVSAGAETVGPEARYIHLGLTSSDVLDTGLACQLNHASELLLEDLKELLSVLKSLSLRYQKTPMMGRTHGIHA